MLKINLFKILFILQRDNYMITTGDLASITNIHYKNIGRYLNFLQDKNLISRFVYQEKKTRFILNSLTWKGEDFVIPKNYNLLLKKIYES